MDTCIDRVVRARREVVFDLAAAVEDWPTILPHYRRVAVLDVSHRTRLVEMAARRDVGFGLAIPLWWRARQVLDRDRWQIRFDHVAGATRGMRVEWRFELSANQALHVQIRHEFAPRWPVPDALIHLIVGEYFVNGVARRTLRRIAELAEAQSMATNRLSNS
jgi:ribosome-associated toxin RatA of RatAB toxin-antitoxin module